MLIQVHYPDNRFDYVNEHVLHRLIEKRAITRFRRSSGWVTVGVDPLRQFHRNTLATPPESFKSIIRVAYDENTYDYVTEKDLNSLIESHKIIKFKRITGWVTLGVDPLRSTQRSFTFRYPSELKKIQK